MTLFGVCFAFCMQGKRKVEGDGQEQGQDQDQQAKKVI